jgi:hypothetical protein
MIAGPVGDLFEDRKERLAGRRETVQDPGRPGVGDAPFDKARVGQFGEPIGEHGVADRTDPAPQFGKAHRAGGSAEHGDDEAVPPLAEQAERPPEGGLARRHVGLGARAGLRRRHVTESTALVVRKVLGKH